MNPELDENKENLEATQAEEVPEEVTEQEAAAELEAIEEDADATEASNEAFGQDADGEEIELSAESTEEGEIAEPVTEGSTAPQHTLPRPSTLTAADLVPVLESILFAADRPVSLDKMREVVAPKPDEDPGPEKEFFTEALGILRARCEGGDYGFELREAHGGFHFVTKMPYAEYIRRYQASKPFRLGRAALETLSIIAYRQPITRAEIDQVRGMDSSHLMRTLIERGLVRMAGKAEVPGRPVLYGTTPRFLEVMGLNSLNDLPPLSELKQLEGDVDDHTRRMEQGLDRFMQPDPDAEPVKAPAEGETPLFDPGLSEIDALIQSAGKPQEEVFASKLHQEIALANQEALEAFQAATPRRRKKTTVTYDELVGGTEAAAAPAEPAQENPPQDGPDSTPAGNA